MSRSATDENRRGDEGPILEEIFRGGGEAGQILQQIDWATRSVGAVERWPQSLRTALSICLSSRYPICIIWGPERLYLYNDAYSPIVGAKHPSALGALYPDVWPEIWESDIRPILESVESTGQASWCDNILLILQRHGFNEECYFLFSFAPIRDERGQVGGVFTAITETTSQLVGERRLRTLRDLGARTADAKNALQACNLAAGVLAENRHDLPFALFYLIEPGGAQARLVESLGIDPGAPVAPTQIGLNSEAPAWPFDEAVRTGKPVIVDGLTARFGELSGGPWPEPTHTALVLPIARAAQPTPHGFLVAGVSPRRALDADYQSFLGLVANQIATAVANAIAYEEERKRAEALAQLDRAKTAFFSNVSHEFRTPLTLMLGPLEEVLARRQQLEPADQEAVTLAHRNSLRLVKLVNTLLDFSRIEAGRVQASYEPTDLSQFSSDLASVFRAAVEKAGMKLVIDCPPLGQPVHIDRDLWEKIVLNLLSNAFKFTFEGQIAVRIERRGEHAVLSVSDTGTGIAAEELPRLFERFHRIKGARARTHEGSGIGLALVQELVKLHGGSIEVHSEFGVGSTFTVSIPLGTAHLPQDRLGAGRTLASTAIGASAFVQEAIRWLPDASQPDTPASLTAAVDVAPATAAKGEPPQRARILLADDNADMRDYLRRLLERWYDVEAVVDGAQALVAARRQVPDMVLTDVMMPHVDGFELLRELRADPRTAAVPVLVLSARAGEESRVEGLQAGADDYLVKPFSARELLARVSAHLKIASIRRHAEQAIRASDEKLRMALSAARMVAWSHDLVSHHMTHSDNAAEVLGLLPGTRIERFEDALAMLRPEDRERYAAILAGAIARQGEYVWQFPIVRPDNAQVVWLEDRGRVTVDAQGKPLRADGVVMDVTQRKAAEQALREARDAAEDASKAKDRFLAVLSHELRTPLSPVAMMLDSMQDDPQIPRRLREDVRMMRRNLHLETKLIDDLLDLNRVRTGKLRLQMEPVGLHQTIRDVMAICREELRARKLQVKSELRAANDTVWADAARMQQVFWNLLKNAIKFTPVGGQIVWQTSNPSGERLCVQVRDTGVGIAPDLLPRIFDPFEQGNGLSAGGLGLGLAICKAVVELHGGSIRATSSGSNTGATFELELSTIDASTRVESFTPAADSVPGPAGATGRVLLVEDHADTANLLSRLLARSGYQVRTAQSATEALAIVNSGPFDVLISDIGLPDLDGYELMRQIRARHGIHGIALSGYGMEDDLRRSREAGFTEHLVKPVNFAQLKQILRRLTSARTSAQAAAAEDG